jgi:hypothetical protein
MSSCKGSIRIICVHDTQVLSNARALGCAQSCRDCSVQKILMEMVHSGKALPIRMRRAQLQRGLANRSTLGGISSAAKQAAEKVPI